MLFLLKRTGRRQISQQSADRVSEVDKVASAPRLRQRDPPSREGADEDTDMRQRDLPTDMRQRDLPPDMRQRDSPPGSTHAALI